MSDGGRWRRVYCLEWHEGALQGLSNDERVIYFYAKTGPQSTSVGIFRMSTAVAAEDLGNVTPVEFDYRLDCVCQAFGWRFDPVTRVLWIPRWLHDNPPQSPNVCTSWRKILTNLPDCDLKFEAASAVFSALKDLPQAFREAFGSLPRDSRKNEPQTKAKPQAQTEADQGAVDQGSVDQRIRGSVTGSRTKTNPSEPTNGTPSEPPAHLVTAARQTLKLTSPHSPLAELVDALKITLRQNGGGDCSSVDAQKALNVALAERRVQ